MTKSRENIPKFVRISIALKHLLTVFFSKSILYRKGNRLDPKDTHNFAGSGFKTFSTDPDLNTFASYIFFLQTIALNVQIFKEKVKEKKIGVIKFLKRCFTK